MRYALRALARTPVFTLAATLTLALGIGANSALFSVADPLLTRPLPEVRDPGRLVLLRTLGSPRWTDDEALVPFALHERINQQSTAFDGAFAWDHQAESQRMRVRTDPDQPFGAIVSASLVSGTFFETLGVRSVLGRLLDANDDRSAAAPAAVLSHAFWQARYQGDPDVVGTPIALDMAFAAGMFGGVAATIVGVAPRGFHGPDIDASPDVWLPLLPARVSLQQPITSRINVTFDGRVGILRTMARLRPGIGLEQAQAEVDVLAPGAFETLQGQYAGVATTRPRILVEPAATGYSAVRDRFREPARILALAVGFLLLMACANVAALLLARVTARQKELAVRLSLGSGRWAIVRLLLAEGAIVAAAGAGLGLLVASWASRAAPAHLPDELAHLAGSALDLRMLGFTAGLSLFSVLVFSVAPAVWSARLPLGRAMREGTGQVHASRSVAGLHRLIVVAQVAFAVALLAGGALFLRSLGQLRAVNAGFDAHRLVQFGVEYEMDLAANFRSINLPDALLERLGSLPGVEALTFYRAADGPLQDDEVPGTVDATDDSGGSRHLEVSTLFVGPRFFETMGIDIVAGRSFDDRDHAPGTLTTIVSDSLARELFGSAEAALGRTVLTGIRAEIVGVARSVAHRSLRDARAWSVYTPGPPAAGAGSAVALRTDGSTAQLLPAVRAAVREFGPRFDVRDLRTFAEIRESSILGDRALAHVSGAFALLAALLTAVGIYGVVAYTVQRRTPEIGLRMALGARPRQVVGTVAGRILLLVAGGIALGLLGVWAGTPLVASQLFGVTAADPLALGAAVLIAAGSSVLAACAPALRAARRIDPIVVLKGD